MPANHLLPIPLPTGRVGNTGTMSIFFSPRLVALGPTGTLRDYPWRDWPAVVNDAAFGLTVVLDGGPVPVFNVVSPPADSAVWAAVFGDPTTSQVEVEPWHFINRADTPFPAPYSPAQLTSDALAVYRQVAVDHAESPPTGGEVGAISTVQSLLGANLDAAMQFMKPLEPEATSEPEEPSFEFHAVITYLAAHPELLRHLGLVVDVEFQLPAVPPTGVTVSTNYAAMFPGAAGPGMPVRFLTNVDADFRALPNPDPRFRDQFEGFLPLAGGEYSITSVDPLVGAQRLAGYRSSLNGNGSVSPLPALREQGISIIRNDMTKVLKQKFIRQADIEEEIADQLNNPPQPAVALFAEDITQGQRYDARDTGTAQWRSLFDRQAPAGYEFPADVSIPPLDLLPKPDEGWRGFTLMTEAETIIEQQGEEPPRDLTPQRINDSVFRWTGWSAVTRMPGQMLDGASGETEDQQENEPRPTDPVQFKVDYRPVPGTLPRLRYGHTYDMRARCVDFAGNSRQVTEPNPTNAVITETFGRLQPVEPPAPVRRSPRPTPGVGDTTSTIVIKSEHDQSDGSVEPAERLLFPPRLSQHRVELHDRPKGGLIPAAYGFFATRDALDLTAQTVADPFTNELVAGELIGDEIVPGSKRPQADYLVDPAAAGVTFERLPAAGGAVVVPYGGSWPKSRAIRFELRGGDREPRVFQPNSPTSVRVWLPKACVTTVEVSSAIAEDVVGHFKLWHEMSTAEQIELRQLILDGRHWMVSARDQITLVHAVRLPLTRPEIHTLSADRPALGSLVATFDGATTIDRKSTESLMLHATWTDPVDDPTQSAPTDVTTQAVLARLPVALEGDPLSEPFAGLDLNVHDTKRHQVDLVAEVFSRFSRYFTEQSELAFDFADEAVTIDERGVVGSEVTVTDAAGTVYTREVDFRVDGPTGTITRHPNGAIPVGEPLTVTFIPRPVSRLATEGDGQTTSVLVPNASSPLPPQVEEIVPAFARTVVETEDSIRVTHSGSVLRVYVRRPWFSTGRGETLGVLLDTGAVAGVLPESTRIGRDPLVAGTGTEQLLALDDWTRATETAVAIDAVHDVAGHEMTFDEGRGLWFTDIELSGDIGYRPFVALALARYQPESIAGAHLSSIVRPDPVRLGPTRLVIVDRQDDGAAVTVIGGDAGNVMTVTVQQANPDIADPDLRWEDLLAPVELTRQPLATGAQWEGTMVLPVGDGELRLLIADGEPATRQVDGTAEAVHNTVYVETVAIPTRWVS